MKDASKAILSVAIGVLPIELMVQAEVRAQTPPPIIVPQVQPRFNNPGPQLTIPQSGNSIQQRTIRSGPTFVPSRSAEKHRLPAAKHQHVSRKSHSKEPTVESSGQAPNKNERQANTGAQEKEQTDVDKKLRELDEALNKKLQGICRGC